MRRTSICFAAALSAALAVGAISGCGSQPAPSESAPAESAEATADVEQSQDQIIAELKELAANRFAYQSVTVDEDITTVTKGEEEAPEDDEATENVGITGDDEIGSKTVYKFDASGDTLRTSMVTQIDDVTLAYYSDGDDAVVVTDGPVYSGTTEQFDLPHFKGVESYLTDTFGDLHVIVDCADTVTKGQQGDATIYTITVNPEKYIAADELLALLAEYGDPLQSATFTFGFDQQGRMVMAESVEEYTTDIAHRVVTLSDFDSTVVEPMPEADRTYEQMEQDEQMKLDALAKQIEGAEEAESEESAEDAA